ncbi:HEAT repeat domain-containing protein [Schlesneria sp. T3-172]|uniref:HEAT repeat domain-containing protein n=1 Tax=Schlesneria sphaerica TaxID=3373610 RepID=UPI0037C65EB4
MNWSTGKIAFLMFLLTCVLWTYVFINADTSYKRHVVLRHIKALQNDLRKNPSDPTSIAKLINITNGNYSFGATKATIALGEMAPFSLAVRKQMVLLLNSPNLYVQREAAISLANCGAGSVDVIEEMVNYLETEHSSRDSVGFVVEAIGNIGCPASQYIAVLRSRLGQGSVLDMQLLEAINKLENCSTE